MFSFRSILTYFATAFTFNLGGGIGEAALMGALFGGAKAAVTGQDLVEGALLGGVTGGAMNGVSAAIGGLGSAAGTAATTGVNSATQTGLGLSSSLPGTTGASMFTKAIPESLGGMSNVGLTQGVGINSLAKPATEQLATQIPGASQGIARVGANPYTPKAPFVGLKEMINPEAGGMVAKGLDFAIKNPYTTAGIGGAAYGAMNPVNHVPDNKEEKSKFAGYNRDEFTPYEAQQPNPYPNVQYAEGGIASMAGGGAMAGQAYPQGLLNSNTNDMPSQSPMNNNVVDGGYEPAINTYTGSQVGPGMADGGIARFFGGGGTGPNGNNYSMGAMATRMNQQPQIQSRQSYYNQSEFNASPNTGQPNTQIYHPQYEDYAEGGIAGYSLGGYAAGGNPRLLKGPGDGMSDNIPATIGNKQPARLADGEFVVPADVVSHLGNGSTDAGAKHLYNMMDKVRKARTGKKAQGTQINPNKFMPA